MKVCCVFSLESPHRGDSNKYTQYTIFNIKKKITLDYCKSAPMGLFNKGLKNEFKTVVVNEPSVFEPLKFYCTFTSIFCANSNRIHGTLLLFVTLVEYIHVKFERFINIKYSLFSPKFAFSDIYGSARFVQILLKINPN